MILNANYLLTQQGIVMGTTFINVLRRSGAVTAFDGGKIRKAISKAVAHTVKTDPTFNESSYQAIADEVNAMINKKVFDFIDETNQTMINVEQIQDIVENTLMLFPSINKVAINYIRYRNEHSIARTGKFTTDNHLNDVVTISPPTKLDIVTVGEKTYTRDTITSFYSEIKDYVGYSCKDVSVGLIVNEFFKTVYKNMSLSDFQSALLLAPRCFIEEDPAYDTFTANVLLQKINYEVLGSEFLTLDNVDVNPPYKTWVNEYLSFVKESALFNETYIKLLDKIINSNTLSPLLDMSIMCNYVNFKSRIKLLGLQTLYDRYLVRDQSTKTVKEHPIFMFMRVALTTTYAVTYTKAIEPSDEFIESKFKSFLDKFEALCKFDYMNSTPTLFNSGLCRQQLSSCYVTTVSDDLENIYDNMKHYALLSKYAGGIGTDWTNVRALGSLIKGTNGLSQGVIPFLKVVNDTAVAVNQGGKRKGAICSYLETWHLDIEEFLELRKNTGDDRRRTHDMNTANWIPDLFMRRVEQDGEWTLFTPSDTPDLHDLYGEAFDKRYEEYEALAEKGEIVQYKKIKAVTLWRKMLSMLYETGHPWITFKDTFNLRNPQRHRGVIHSSNLCTEIGLVNNEEEISVCNLGSVNLPNHYVKDNAGNYVLDKDKLRKTVRLLTESLDTVIDNNYYPVKQAEKSNMVSRPIGIGIMGLQDVAYLLGYPFDDLPATVHVDIMKTIYVEAIKTSHELSLQLGAYPSFEGSDWSKGILPHDTYLSSIKSETVDQAKVLDSLLNEDPEIIELRELVKKGMRNCCLFAIAPTATIANIVGVVPSIEPTYRNLYTKSNLSGEFMVYNPYLVEKLKGLGLWNEKTKADLKNYEGSLKELTYIPDDIKSLFKTSFECDQLELIIGAAYRQIFIDQAQSLNLYVVNPSGKKLAELYTAAWRVGLKSTYYLRTVSASKAEMSTGGNKQLTGVDLTPKVCSIDNPDCESCQ